MYRILIVVSAFITLLIGCETKPQPSESTSITAKFVERQFIKEGAIQTDITANKNVYLSESLGLWMHYLLLTNQQKKFDEQVKIIKSKFLLEHGLISWQIATNEVSQTNALIDDFRIITALYEATQLWGENHYEQLANQIGSSLVKHQLVNSYFVDFYDGATANDFITLSYIDPIALKHLLTHNQITIDQYETNIQLISKLPLQNGWFPQRYQVKTNQFEYETTVNLIDQYYIGYHIALIGGTVDNLVHFTEQQMAKEGKLVGRVDAITLEKQVNYESPAVYALAYLMMKQLDEESLAGQLLGKMHALQISDASSEFYGGYIDANTYETHFFDNVLPVLAEEGWYE